MLSQKQKKTINRQFADNSFEVWEGTPRSGKTTAGILRFARFILNCQQRDFLILAYSQEQAFNLIIQGDGRGLQNIFAGCCRTKKGQSGSFLEIATYQGIKRIFYKGAGKKGDHKQFQGRGFGGVYFCEINLLDKETVQEAMRRTIASPLRVHFADLNPPSPHHWVCDFFEENKAIWSHWTMEDNPILTPARVQAIKEQLQKNPYLYQRDFLGLRVLPEGLIYNMWNSEENQATELQDDEQIIEMWFAADGGVDHATSVLCFFTTAKKVTQGSQWIKKPEHLGICYIADGYYYSGAESGNKAMSLQAQEIKRFVDRCLGWYKPKFSTWSPRPMKGYSHFFCDPACLALAEELRILGIDVENADNNHREGVVAGIEAMQDLIQRRKFKLLNDRKNGNNHMPFLKGISSYAWDKDGKPIKLNDDVMDAFRYGGNYYKKTYIGAVI